MEMIINNHNCFEINSEKLNIHDCILEGFSYDYFENIINVSLSSFGKEKFPITILFRNVIGMNLVACDFWGETQRIDRWYCLGKSQWALFCALTEEKNENNYDLSRIDCSEFFESVISTISGDKITIVCEQVVVDL